MKRIGIAVAASVLVCSLGCMSALKTGSTLIEDVYAYNDGVRWNHFVKAAIRIHPREREAFIAERSELEEDLRISGYEILNIAYQNKEKVRASVQIKYTWYQDSVGTVHKTTSVQQWRRFGKRWLVVKEKRVDGEAMPGMEDPDEDSEAEIVEEVLPEAEPEGPEAGDGEPDTEGDDDSGIVTSFYGLD